MGRRRAIIRVWGPVLKSVPEDDHSVDLSAARDNVKSCAESRWLSQLCGPSAAELRQQLDIAHAIKQGLRAYNRAQPFTPTAPSPHSSTHPEQLVLRLAPAAIVAEGGAWVPTETAWVPSETAPTTAVLQASEHAAGAAAETAEQLPPAAAKGGTRVPLTAAYDATEISQEASTWAAAQAAELAEEGAGHVEGLVDADISVAQLGDAMTAVHAPTAPSTAGQACCCAIM